MLSVGHGLVCSVGFLQRDAVSDGQVMKDTASQDDVADFFRLVLKCFPQA